MAEITRVYRQEWPRMKFVGKRYSDADRVNGFFSHKWTEWFEKDLFAPLALGGGNAPCEDADSCYGLCLVKEGEPFQYWIGVFMPPDAAVPEGYDSLDAPAMNVAVCWVRGKEPDIYTHCCLSRLAEEGYKWTPDENGVLWYCERYVDTRFTLDENGNITLDQCFRIA